MTSPLCPLTARYSYHVLVSCAPMPNNCWGVYKRVGLIEVDHHERPIGWTPKTIRAAYGVRVVETWERLNVGTTSACAFARAHAEARTLANECRAQRLSEAADDLGVAA